MLIQQVRQFNGHSQTKGTQDYSKCFLSQQEIQSCFPKLTALATKGQRGRPLICAGSTRYHGAAILAGTACSRMGADYTYLVTHGEKLGVIS